MSKTSSSQSAGTPKKPNAEAMNVMLNMDNADMAALGETSGSRAVFACGSSLNALYIETMKIPGAKEAVAELFKEHAKMYNRIVTAYLKKKEELTGYEARLDSVAESIGDLISDIKPCTCVSGNCASCACSKKNGFKVCTDRCKCNDTCVRQQGDEGLTKEIADIAKEASDEAKKQLRKERRIIAQGAKDQMDAAKEVKKQAIAMMKEAAKAAEAAKAKIKKQKKKVQSESDSGSGSDSDDDIDFEALVISSDSDEEDKKKKKKKKNNRK
jgi:hypothetical protein